METVVLAWMRDEDTEVPKSVEMIVVAVARAVNPRTREYSIS